MGVSHDGGILLITPLGLSPGVIYSALVHVKPARAIVVTSKEGAMKLPMALKKAQAITKSAPVDCLVREMEDPFTGYQEASRILDSKVRGWLQGADTIVLNLSGGTTMLQYIVEYLARVAERLGVPVRRGIALDRRLFAEQGRNPYVLGEWVELLS